MPDPKFGAVQYYNYPVTDENMTGSSVSGDTELYYTVLCAAWLQETPINAFSSGS